LTEFLCFLFFSFDSGRVRKVLPDAPFIPLTAWPCHFEDGEKGVCILTYHDY
jgi:hypothetical protein